MSTAALTTSRVASIAAAALLLAALVVLGIRAADADAVAARELGRTNRTPGPLCPKDCRATGSVTGFQVEADGKRKLFKAPSDGHIVAWSVDLSKPTDDQIDSFSKIFEDKKYNGAPVARLAILKDAGKNRFKLAKQSPPIKLRSRLGRRPVFTLGKPIRVQKGRAVALTLPTWAPLFRDGLSRSADIWAASRDPDKCSGAEVPDAKPQQKVGSTRTYGCRLKGERILYWAYFVPSKK